ncbi:hypothetical protein U8P76_29070 (plasmid) [Rhizobium johnstonii]|nr:hypothetical protein U8P76_29070 [Rhizobium johnstonii]
MEGYASHPAHLRIRDSLKDVRIARHRGRLLTAQMRRRACKRRVEV